MIAKIEQKVFFRLTRAFAWIVIVAALIAVVSSGLYWLKTSGTPDITVGYNEVQSAMEENAQSGDKSTPPPVSRKDNEKDEFGSDVEDLVKALGENNRKIVNAWIENKKKQDRKTFVRGLVKTLRKAPEGEKSDAANAYRKLWDEKMEQRDMESSARSANKSMAQLIFAAAFSAAALFSLILIMLAIEKNTREKITTGN